MKISACSVSFRNEPSDIFQICDFIAGIGIKYIEIWGNHLDLSKSFEKFSKNLLDGLRSRGLACSIISPYFDLTGSKKAFYDSLELGKTIFTVAELIESPLVRVFTGTVSSDRVDPRKYEQCLSGLEKLSENAAQHGLKLAIETHPNTLVDTLQSTKRLLEDVDRENVGINLDIFHLWEVHKKTIQIFDTLKPHVFHMHAKNARHSQIKDSHQFLHGQQAQQKFFGIINLENGDMPYEDLLQHLSANYTETISIEWFGEHPRENIEKDLRFMQKFV